MKLGIKLGAIIFPEVDKFFYWVDICLLSGFLSSFSEKDSKNGLPLCKTE